MCAVSTIRGLTACLGLTFSLGGAVSSVAVAQQTLPREDLLALEQALAQLNFDPGKVDGTVDDRTRAAVRLYQEFAALEPNGEITQNLIAEVRSVAESFKDLRGVPVPAESASAAPSPSPAPAPTVASSPPQAPAPAQEAKPAIAAAPEPKPATPEPKPTAPAQAAAPAPVEAPVETPAPVEAPAKPPIQAEAPPSPKPEPRAETPVVAAKPAPTKAPPESKPPAASPPAKPTEQASAQAPQAAAAPQPKTPQPEAPAKPPAAGYDVGGLLSRLKSGGETAKPSAEKVDLGAGQVARLTDQGTGLPAPSVAEFGGDGYGALRAGYLAAQSGDLERAVRLYSEALDSQKLTLDHAAGAHYNRANAFFYLGDFDKAIDDYAAAIGNKPGFADAYYNRGFAFQAKGDKRQAVEDFHRARDLGLQRLGVRAPDAPPPLQ